MSSALMVIKPHVASIRTLVRTDIKFQKLKRETTYIE